MEHSPHSSPLPHITLASLQETTPEAIDEILQLTQPVHLPAGEILFSHGDDFQQKIYLLRQGKLEIRYEHAVYRVQPNELLGIDCYLDDSPRNGTAVALEACQLEVLQSASLRQLEKRYPALLASFNRLLALPLRQRHQPVTGVWSLTARAVMQSPLATCEATLPVRQAFGLMRERRIGSLGVNDDTGVLQGIITYASLAEGLISRDASPDGPVTQVCAPLLTVDDDTPLWKIQREQQQQHAKYLVVMEQHHPVGVISQTDILETLASYQRSLIAQIGEAQSFEELCNHQSQMGHIARELSENNRSASHAVRALSEIHLAIQRRCVDLVLAELAAQGHGPAPMGYALIIMGSGGRKEMMLQTDQDNGIILAREPADEATRQWFTDFCEQVNQRLDQVGYEWCRGDIMARNPDFNRSLQQWCTHIERITEIPSEKAARWSSIFFDFETLHGDDGLCVTLRKHLLQALAKQPHLLRLMVEDDATGTPALGLFNRLITASDAERKGKIDLKRNGTRILADAARIYALSEGIEATNTTDRLHALMRQGRLEPDFVEAVLATQEELLDLTLHHQIRQMDNREPLDKLLRPAELTPLEGESLRAAMRVLKRLQGRMQGEFGTVML